MAGVAIAGLLLGVAVAGYRAASTATASTES